MSQIKDKVVAITGGSSGLGEATARLLASEGAKVFLGARREGNLKTIVEEIRAAGGTADYKPVDVVDRNQVEQFVNAAKDAFGRLDVLINNAGLMPLSPLSEGKVDEWDRMVDVNIKGVLYGIAAALPIMQAQKDGHIINLSSVAGHVVFPGAAVYCGTKFAVRAITEGLRMEIGSDIRATSISPGAVATELTGTISHAETAANVNTLYESAIEPDAVARAIAFAIEQPRDVDINDIILRPTAQVL
jgi:NADP-dependent 3-hydroxy acid dehydrogenase YdfG